MRILIGSFLILILISSVFANNAFGEKFDKKSCIAKIPKDAGFAVANKMRQDCEDKERIADSAQQRVEEKKRLDKFYTKKNDYTCESEYDKYKILGEIKFRKWTGSNQINADVCLALYKDPVWQYKGTDRAKKLADWYENYVKNREENAKIAKSKSFGTTVGNVKTPDLEELEKRINKKLEKLEKENKQLKEQVKKLKTSNSK